MRGKVARHLRKLANATTVGQPARAYKTKRHAVPVRGKPLMTHVTHQVLLITNCTRYRYQKTLKKAFKITRKHITQQFA